MMTIVVGFLFATTLSWALTFGVRRTAFRIGAVDHPDGSRKLQPHPVPTSCQTGRCINGRSSSRPEVAHAMKAFAESVGLK